MLSPVKNKILFGGFIWLVMCFVMFGWIFKKFANSTQLALEDIMVLKREEALLEAERQSFIQARNDLDKLADTSIHPTDFFSRDITLVNEIRRLENIATELGLIVNFSGITGTLKTGKSAGTVTEMIRIPFIISIQGSLPNTLAFIEYLENLEFITPVNSVNISSGGLGIVNATLDASFYVKK